MDALASAPDRVGLLPSVCLDALDTLDALELVVDRPVFDAEFSLDQLGHAVVVGVAYTDALYPNQ